MGGARIVNILKIDKIFYGVSGIAFVHPHINLKKCDLSEPHEVIRCHEAEWKVIPGLAKILIASCPKCGETAICVERRK